MDASAPHAAVVPVLPAHAVCNIDCVILARISTATAATYPCFVLPALATLQVSGMPLRSIATLSFAEDMNPRYRSTMEDAHTVVDDFGVAGAAADAAAAGLPAAATLSTDNACGFFGVYDGHGGRNVAEYLRLHLHNNVERELREKGDRSVEECLRAAFVLTDVECHDTGEQASGSTAVVCVVRRQGAKRYVYTANVGDARAVLCHAGVAVRLSKDHKATDACERTRVETSGGFVIRKRVMGVLAVARSFGDFVLKKYVPAEPYTSTTKLDGMVRWLLVLVAWWVRARLEAFGEP